MTLEAHISTFWACTLTRRGGGANLSSGGHIAVWRYRERRACRACVKRDNQMNGIGTYQAKRSPNFGAFLVARSFAGVKLGAYLAPNA